MKKSDFFNFGSQLILFYEGSSRDVEWPNMVEKNTYYREGKKSTQSKISFLDGYLSDCVHFFLTISPNNGKYVSFFAEISGARQDV